MNTYRLLKAHTHRGILHPAGSIIALNDRQAQWLAEQGVVAMSGIVARPQPARQQPAPPAARRCAGCGR